METRVTNNVGKVKYLVSYYDGKNCADNCPHLNCDADNGLICELIG